LLNKQQIKKIIETFLCVYVTGAVLALNENVSKLAVTVTVWTSSFSVGNDECCWTINFRATVDNVSATTARSLIQAVIVIFCSFWVLHYLLWWWNPTYGLVHILH